jgi:hypothetical protein
MDCFEREGVVYKHVPAGGTGGGATGAAVVKASEAEAAAFRATLVPADEPEAEVPAAAVAAEAMQQDTPPSAVAEGETSDEENAKSGTTAAPDKAGA